MDFPTELLQTSRRMILDVESKICADLVTFLFIQAKNDIKIFLESADELQRTRNVFRRTLFGICEINK